MAIEFSTGTFATALRGMLQALWAPKSGDSTTMQAIEATGGAIHVAVQYDYRGNPPETKFLQIAAASGVNDNDILFTSPDVSEYNTHYIESTVGTVDLEVSLDGTNWNTASPPAVLLHDATAVGTYSLTIGANKIGILNMKVTKFRVRQNGATAATARAASGVR